MIAFTSALRRAYSPVEALPNELLAQGSFPNTGPGESAVLASDHVFTRVSQIAVMECSKVGRSGVEISRVGLGGYELGPEPGERPDVDRAVRVIEAALACGVKWLDTS